MSSYTYLVALLLPPMLIIGALVFLTSGGSKRKALPSVEDGTVVKEKKSFIFLKEGLGFNILPLVLVTIILSFVFFYDWASTPPGEVLQPMMGEKWFTWTIKAVAVLLGIVYIAKLIFPKTDGKGGMSVLSFLLGLLIAVGAIGVIGVWGYSYISTPKSTDLTVDFRGVEFGKTQKVLLGLEDTVTVMFTTRKFERGAPAYQEWACPRSQGIPLMFAMNTRDSFALTEESKADLLRQHSMRVDIVVTSTRSLYTGQGLGSENPCPYLKLN